MEAAMKIYVRTVQEFDDKLSESTREFEKRLESSERFRCQARTINIARAATTLLKMSKNRFNKKIPPIVPTWWEIFVQQHYPEVRCLKYLKISRKSYIYLVKLLRPHISPKIGAIPRKRRFDMIHGISVEKQVAIMLHKLGRCKDYNIMSTMFGIHKSAVCKIFHKVVQILNKYLLHDLIKMPTCDEAKEIARHLEDVSRIPQLIGALESTHIPICLNDHAIADRFTNSNDYPSVVLQAVVDSNYCFRDVSVRHPGSVNDQRILEDSSIYKFVDRVIPIDTKNINGVEIPYKIAAPFSYPLLPWLLTGFESAVTQGELFFNDQLRIARNLSSVALDNVKARFVILSQITDANYKLAPQIIAACCAIHNICQINDDPFLDEWIEEFRQNSDKFPQPEITRGTRLPDPKDLRLREIVRDYLETHLLLENAAFAYIDHENMSILTEAIK